MHSRVVSISAFAAIMLLPMLWVTNAGATDWFDGQEILIECPIWKWQASQIPDVEYELCFDDTDHCAATRIGDSVCIPSYGAHDVWVTAIEYQSGEPIYHDGDIVRIMRSKNADFSGNGSVGFEDFGLFTQLFSEGNVLGDLDGDGAVGFADLAYFIRDFGKCVNASETVYEPC